MFKMFVLLLRWLRCWLIDPGKELSCWQEGSVPSPFTKHPSIHPSIHPPMHPSTECQPTDQSTKQQRGQTNKPTKQPTNQATKPHNSVFSPHAVDTWFALRGRRCALPRPPPAFIYIPSIYASMHALKRRCAEPTSIQRANLNSFLSALTSASLGRLLVYTFGVKLPQVFDLRQTGAAWALAIVMMLDVSFSDFFDGGSIAAGGLCKLLLVGVPILFYIWNPPQGLWGLCTSQDVECGICHHGLL